MRTNCLVFGFLLWSAANQQFGTEVAGTTVCFNGIAAPILYTSATPVLAVAPYALAGTSAQVTVTYQDKVSAAFTVSVAPSAASIFTLNQTGAEHAAAINADGSRNTAANPVKIGDWIWLYATGEGQTEPVGQDGRIVGAIPLRPVGKPKRLQNSKSFARWPQVYISHGIDKRSFNSQRTRGGV